MAENGPLRFEVRIGGMTLDQLNRREVEAPDYGDERLHCEECAVCGQTYDRRYLGDSLYHSSPDAHLPLAGSPGFEFVAIDEEDEALFRWSE